MGEVQNSNESTQLNQLTRMMGHDFKDQDRLIQALTHKSFAHERGVNGGSGRGAERGPDNERFEFLGDAVLDLAMSDLLMARFPNDPEGSLSKKRASLVNEETLASVARELGLEALIRLGKGESKTGGLQKPRILASTVEALLGAIYLDTGFDSARAVVETLFQSRFEAMDHATIDFSADFKTRLQEKAQEIKKSTPLYSVDAETGPDHDKCFEVSVTLEGVKLASGKGKSKKSAEQDAAKNALEQWV
jgi:ribonuclease-3